MGGQVSAAHAAAVCALILQHTAQQEHFHRTMYHIMRCVAYTVHTVPSAAHFSKG